MSSWLNQKITVVEGFLTEEMAQLVRKLRIDEDGSWRSVSENFEQHFPGLQQNSGHQMDGMALCYVAATMLGEDPTVEPWN